MTIVALVPAHNEAAGISLTLDSIVGQVDRVIVVADNCTDDTVGIALGFGCDVLSTEGNVDKKAGALNQALDRLLPSLDGDDLVLALDADSTVGVGFVRTAATRFVDGVGAVGGVFHGEPGGGLVGALQRMEYGRYARDLRRTGRVWVLTGTATLHRVSVLRQVAAARGSTLPGHPGDVYDRDALTEDMEVTLAIKALGYRLVSPASCRVTTEIMPTWGDLFTQRLRWQRGAIENLRTYGVRRVTLPYLRQQGVVVLSLVALTLYFGCTVWWASQGLLGLSPIWTTIGALFLTERVVTVWAVGWRARGIASLLVVDLAYDLFLQSVIVRAIADTVLHRPQRWQHLTGGRR